MRPEVALAVPVDRRDGRWFLIRADYPNDAFAHVRHIKDGVICGNSSPHVEQLESGVAVSSPPIPPCMVEEVFDGVWTDLADVLSSRFGINEPANPAAAKVPPRFDVDVAPDVEAD